MKIKKIRIKDELRIRMGDGETDGKSFVISFLASGKELGVLVEFDDEAYLAPTEDVVKEILKFRGKK